MMSGCARILSFAGFGAALAIAALLVPLVFLLWLDITAPSLRIDTPTSTLTRLHDDGVIGSNVSNGRLIATLLLEGSDRVPIEAAMSRPVESDEGARRLPVLILIGGFDTGMRSVEYVDEPGPNVVIGYGYPGRNVLRASGAPIERLVAAQRGAHRVPGQIAALAVWAARQPWADRHQVVLLGVSLGALFAPAAARAMATAGVPPRAVVLADGGADLTRLVRRNLRQIGWVWRSPLAWGIATLLRRLEPARHLPHLQSDLLLIHATADPFIPLESAILMDRLTPEPKTIVTLTGGHIVPGEPARVDAMLVTVRKWLASMVGPALGDEIGTHEQ